MSLATIATMIFALGSIYGGLALSLAYFFKKRSHEDISEDNQ
jgi:hypothetical protein